MLIKYLKCRPKNHKFPIIAWVIMLFQKQNPLNKKASSHRAIQFSEDRVIDSSGGFGVKVYSKEEFLKKYKITDYNEFFLEVSREELWMWADNIINRKYDYLDVLGDLLRLIFKRNIFKKVGKDLERLTCNEVAISFSETFFDIDIDYPDVWDLITTDKLMKDVSNAKYKAKKFRMYDE